MREDIAEAIESASTVEVKTDGTYSVERRRKHNPMKIRAIVLAVVRELPDDMSISELRDELEICSNQDAGIPEGRP